MKNRTAFISAILSLIPLGKPLLIKTSFLLSIIVNSISNAEKIYAFPIDFKSSNTCSEYKYKGGQSIVEPTEDGLKMITTSEVRVVSDFREDVIEAISKADSKAKIAIYRFISSEIAETITLDNYREGQSISSELIPKHKGKMSDTKNSMRKLNSIIKLGECYEPNKFVRVTFGIKPETIKHFKSNPK